MNEKKYTFFQVILASLSTVLGMVISISTTPILGTIFVGVCLALIVFYENEK